MKKTLKNIYHLKRKQADGVVTKVAKRQQMKNDLEK